MDDRPSRRRYLVGLGSAVALSGCAVLGGTNRTDSPATDPSTETPTPTATPAPGTDIVFDRVLDAVADLGFDPTGAEPIDAAFAAAYETGTLIEFPPGTYRVAETQVGDAVSRFGIRGLGETRRDVQIAPAPGAALRWLKAVGAGPHLIENLSFDEGDDDTRQLSLWLSTTDGSVVRNVEWLGRTPADSAVEYTMTAETTDVDGIFHVERVYAGLDQPAKPVQYPNGVPFLLSGPSHRGELLLRHPVIQGRNSDATRSTSPSGVLTIEGGSLLNNQNASIRFGAGDHPSKVSSATGTYVGADGSRNSVDAVRVDASSNGYAGAIFRDLEIWWESDTGRGVITLPRFGGHGRAEFSNCVVRNDGNLETVDAEPTDVDDRAVVFRDCSFTGSGGGFFARQRPGSLIDDTCIDMPNARIEGFQTRNVSRSGCRVPARAPVDES